MILFLLAFVAFLIIGIPISVSIGFSAVLGCLSLGYPLVVIGQKMVPVLTAGCSSLFRCSFWRAT